LFANGNGILMDVSLLTFILLAGGGIVTAVPLLYFAKGAQRIPLSMVGFLQYIAPTIMLFVGTVMFHEPFSSSQLLTFMLIWIGSIIFSLSKTKFMLSHQPRFKKESSLH
jgi:chloramphenicol-sensitive protein RarD